MSDDLPTRFTQLEHRFQSLQAAHEALKRQKTDTLHQVFYRIAERATAGLSFFEFLRSVHELLGELMYARNCYVCLYDTQNNTLDFPYYIDERDGDTLQRDHVPFRRGLTEFVLRTAQPQLIDAARFVELQASGEITGAAGDLTFTTWLGVPMQIRGRLGGVLVVQSYEAGVQYSEADVEHLSFVANHFSSAIERYQAIEALRQSEERYRTIMEHASVGVVVVKDGRMVFANTSMVRIVGHPMAYLLSTPFTATIHPEDVPEVIARHRQRLQDMPVEQNYGFRIITAAGEVRTLDLSAVKIEWEGRQATLLFVMDATARLQAESAQRTALQQQSALNDLKTRFITMASHELRTPLASIHGSVELLTHYDTLMTAEKKRLALQNIDDAVGRMTHMLENVMQIGRSDAGQLQFRPKAMALTPFCLVLIDELRGTMARSFARVSLQLNLCPQDDVFLLDDALVRNIVGNLVSNAIKYSPHGGEVMFSVVPSGDSLVITVADQGIGIPEVDQERLFQSFHRAGNVGNIAGTGLGLSIVREAVICHNGSITVTSQEGQGSTFTVILPTSKVAAEVPTKVPMKGVTP